jgi:hypothetical protein
MEPVISAAGGCLFAAGLSFFYLIMRSSGYHLHGMSPLFLAGLAGLLLAALERVAFEQPGGGAVIANEAGEQPGRRRLVDQSDRLDPVAMDDEALAEGSTPTTKKCALGTITWQRYAGFQESRVKVSPGQLAPQNEAMPSLVRMVTLPSLVVKVTLPWLSTYSQVASPTKPATPMPSHMCAVAPKTAE